MDVAIGLIVFGVVALAWEWATTDLGLEPDRPHTKVMDMPAAIVWFGAEPLEALEFSVSSRIG